jgi:hypothetical protein
VEVSNTFLVSARKYLNSMFFVAEHRWKSADTVCQGGSMHYGIRHSAYKVDLKYLGKAMRCLEMLARYLVRGRCYIRQGGETCGCSVEQADSHIADIQASFFNALDKMWLNSRPAEHNKIYNWAIADEGSLSIMYWCDYDTALDKRWWRKTYGQIPRHFKEEGFLNNG